MLWLHLLHQGVGAAKAILHPAKQVGAYATAEAGDKVARKASQAAKQAAAAIGPAFATGIAAIEITGRAIEEIFFILDTVCEIIWYGV